MTWSPVFVGECCKFFFSCGSAYLNYLFESTGKDLAIASRVLRNTQRTKAISVHVGIEMACLNSFFFLECFGEALISEVLGTRNFDLISLV